MDRVELVNRMWIIVTLTVGVGGYLYHLDDPWYMAALIVGPLAVYHAQLQADHRGWEHGIVLFANIAANFSLFAAIFSLSYVYIAKFLLLVDFIDRLSYQTKGLVLILTALGIAAYCTSYCHDRVVNHYNKIDKEKEEAMKRLEAERNQNQTNFDDGYS